MLTEPSRDKISLQAAADGDDDCYQQMGCDSCIDLFLYPDGDRRDYAIHIRALIICDSHVSDGSD